MSGGVSFSWEDVARLVALARTPSLGRTQAQRVEEVLDQLGPLVSHDKASVFTVDARGRDQPVLVRGIETRDIVDYARYYRHHDPMGRMLTSSPAGTVAVLSDHASRRQVDRTAFSDLLGRQAIVHVLGYGMQLRDGSWFGMALHRERGRPDYTAPERAAIGIVTPILRNVFDRDPLPYGLTPREQAVAMLAAEGAEDREIAARLGIGVATVRTHINHAFGKLGVSSRTELVARELGAPEPACK